MVESHGAEWRRIVVHREGPRDAIVIKPAGLSVELAEDSVPGTEGRSLLAWARRRWPGAEPRLPHRLDRMARGILVLALDAEAASRHGANLRERRWSKHYLVRLAPQGPAPSLGVHRVHLRTRGRRAEVVRSGGRPSVLEVIETAPAPEVPGEIHALIRLETGRHHQIRATMAHLGCPVSGDPLYDDDARGRWRPPYLEHAMLRLPRLLPAGSASTEEVVWRRDDPDREPVDWRLLDRLEREGREPGSE